ncbi:hypothetical protein V1478_004730 [Vespula squamosa]|uniref:Uncharacterized protein n=1 Tax=Vespula squamosa TaxID=30214 RepID=A0ABD2BGZ5_VESSQ
MEENSTGVIKIVNPLVFLLEVYKEHIDLCIMSNSPPHFNVNLPYCTKKKNIYTSTFKRYYSILNLLVTHLGF